MERSHVTTKWNTGMKRVRHEDTEMLYKKIITCKQINFNLYSHYKFIMNTAIISMSP